MFFFRCTETPDGFRSSTDLYIPKKYYKELHMPKIMSTLMVKLQQLKCKDYVELHTIVIDAIKSTDTT